MCSSTLDIGHSRDIGLQLETTDILPDLWIVLLKGALNRWRIGVSKPRPPNLRILKPIPHISVALQISSEDRLSLTSASVKIKSEINPFVGDLSETTDVLVFKEHGL